MNNPTTHTLMREVRQLPIHVLAQVFPQLRPFNLNEADDVRDEFVQWIDGHRGPAPGCWQAAFNLWTGATPHRPGSISYTQSHCPDCHGRRIDMRRGRVCPTCMGGTRRRRRVNTLALWQQPPGADDRLNATSSVESRPLPAVGDRVRVVGVMPNDPDPIPVGAEGIVTNVVTSAYEGQAQIWVDWGDLHRSLCLLESDPYEVV